MVATRNTNRYRKITQTVAEKERPAATTRIAYDGDLPGFGLRVTPSGVKAWIVEYRPGAGGHGAAKRRVTLGSFDVLKAEAARAAAKDMLAHVRLGRDPAGERAKSRVTPALSQFLETFLESEVAVKRTKSTAVGYASDLRRYVAPAFGSVRIDEITKGDVTRLHRKIGKTRPVRANRVLAVLSSLYGYAAATGVVPEGFNPCRGIARFKEEGRERYLTADELLRLGASLKLAETEGLPWTVDETKAKAKHLARPENRRHVFPIMVTAAIRLLLLTGCRLREILHLRWSDVDFDRGLLFLPTEVVPLLWTV